MRPFSLSAGVKSRSYSLPLQRRMTDFGADESFAKACEKMREHYGVSIGPSSMRSVTEAHGKRVKEHEQLKADIPDQGGVECMVAETDGTMIPIVDTFDRTDEAGIPIDKRKTRQVRWKEARLSLAHEKGCVNPVYGSTLGDPDDAGDQLVHCAIVAGMDQHSKVHCVGDGAPWICDQVDRVFGTQADFLIDFYHLCDYLAAASKSCSGEHASDWLDKQKQRMKASKVTQVVEALQPHIEPESVPDKDAPVRKCYRYITNRIDQFDYQSALEADLPIGSGEIESAHRYIIHARLEITGAWWKENNAQDMLALRTLRGNNEWDDYWETTRKYGT